MSEQEPDGRAPGVISCSEKHHFQPLSKSGCPPHWGGGSEALCTPSFTGRGGTRPAGRVSPPAGPRSPRPVGELRTQTRRAPRTQRAHACGASAGPGQRIGGDSKGQGGTSPLQRGPTLDASLVTWTPRCPCPLPYD